MKRLHICVAVFNLVALAAMAIGFMVDARDVREWLLTFAVLGGYVGNLVALLVAIAVAIAFVSRLLGARLRFSLREHWLALANGGAVVLGWTVYFVVGRSTI